MKKLALIATLSSVLVSLVEEISPNKRFKRELKHHGNNFVKEMEKWIDQIYSIDNTEENRSSNTDLICWLANEIENFGLKRLEYPYTEEESKKLIKEGHNVKYDDRQEVNPPKRYKIINHE